jgi:F0F1-type ATP synthase delta subunit
LYAYDVPVQMVSAVLGIAERTLGRWLQHFQSTGKIDKKIREKQRSSRRSSKVLNFVNYYVKVHPCFCFEEIKAAFTERFPSVDNVSDATVCRVLRLDLDLSRKK